MLDKLENVSIVVASAIGLASIKDILGIVILCIQFVLILAKVIIKVKNAKTPEEQVQAIEDAQEEISKKGEQK